MATFAADNFGNDGAREYLALLTAKLVATITEIMAGKGRLALDEDGETMLMPSVELLALLCERYDAVPPKPDMVQKWCRKYLKVYDASVDALGFDDEFKVLRRKAIDNTFRWLQGLADSYWEE